jgi:hypothetical protein
MRGLPLDGGATMRHGAAMIAIPCLVRHALEVDVVRWETTLGSDVICHEGIEAEAHQRRGTSRCRGGLTNVASPAAMTLDD